MGLFSVIKSFLFGEAPASSQRNFYWIGNDSEIEIAGLKLKSPLVYLYNGRCDERFYPFPAAIHPGLPAKPDSGKTGLTYWPSYLGLSSGQRYVYLKWMAGGRKTIPPELGYAFLFLNGLERRALIDRQDIRIVFDETVRLRKMYADEAAQSSGSWERHSGNLLWSLLLIHPAILNIEDVHNHARMTGRWDEDRLSCFLYCLWSRQKPLTAEMAYIVASMAPESQQSLVQKRVPWEFISLFNKRFECEYPGGMKLGISKTLRTYVYQPSSNAIKPHHLRFNDPLKIQRQFKGIVKIWNSCVEDLKRLGTLAGQEIEAVKRWEAMPDELKAGVEHPYAEEFRKLVDSHLDEAGYNVMPVSEIAAVLDPGGAVKISLARGKLLCEMAEKIGYLVEPDARLTGRAYKPDDSVIVFLKVTTAPVDAGRYCPAACMFHFGFLMAGCDGHAQGHELDVIRKHIAEAFDLKEDEIRRFDRLQHLLMNAGPDRALLKKLAKGLNKLQRQAIGRLLVAIAAADGMTSRQERKALESACGILEIEFSEFESLLPGKSDDAVGEIVPVKPEDFTLDRSAIDTILAETRDVARMLAEAMASEEKEEVEEVEEEVEVETQGVVATMESTESERKGPPQRYAGLYNALMARDEWTMDEARRVAKDQGVMLAGAVDALNEWSMDAYGGQLFIEEGERLIVERNLMA